MGETVFRFGIDEISSIRARCKASGCGFVVEMPLARIGNMQRLATCPGCGASWMTRSLAASGPPPGEPFALLQEAAIQISRLTGVAVEFVVTKATVDAT
jgi:hypothetical protein